MYKKRFKRWGWIKYCPRTAHWPQMRAASGAQDSKSGGQSSNRGYSIKVTRGPPCPPREAALGAALSAARTWTTHCFENFYYLEDESTVCPLVRRGSLTMCSQNLALGSYLKTYGEGFLAGKAFRKGFLSVESFLQHHEKHSKKHFRDIVEYKPPGPPPKTGAHRYILVALAPINGTTKKLHLRTPEERFRWGYKQAGAGVRERWRRRHLLARGRQQVRERSRSSSAPNVKHWAPA